MDATEAAVTAAQGTPAPSSATRRRGSARHRLRQAAALMVAVLSVGMVVVGSLLFDLEPDIWVWEGTWLVRELVPGVVVSAAVGLMVLRYRSAVAVGWVLLAMALCWGASALSAGLWAQSFEQGWDTTVQLSISSHFLGGVGAALALFVLPQVFPDGPLTGWFWRLLVLLPLAARLLLGSLGALVDKDDFYADQSAPVERPTVMLLSEIFWYASIALVLIVLVERIRRGPQLVRQQVGPVAVVWLLCLAAEEFRFAEFQESDSSLAFTAMWLWPVIFVATIGITLTQVGLWNTRLVVRRFVTYAAVVAMVTLLFAGVYFLVLLALSSGAVDDRYRWLALLVAAVAVIAADPLRRRVRTALERRLLGERSEPLRPMARLDALASVSDADEEEVGATIASTVAEAVRSPGVSLALHRPAGMEVAASSGDVPAVALILPLVHRGERLGELRVAPRTPGEPYGRLDRALLDQLAHQSAALVYGLRRDSDISTLRSEAIEALVEQRSALGRDLHDGLAPLLAGAGLTADALRRGMPADSPDAAEADRLAVRLRTAASEVRRLSHDLQPDPEAPGLGEVIRDHVAAVTQPGRTRWTVDIAPRAGDGLTTVAELGLSRVALEAITNVVRHARADTATVSLRHDGSEVVLVVSDEGDGIPQPYVAGVGIASMRGRVQALGGTFDIAPRPGGGTLLTARVPLPETGR